MRHTNEQQEIMRQQTIGVEVEMNNITRERAAKVVAEYFGTTAWNAWAEYGYRSWACKDTQGRVWKFQRDCSIAGNDDEKCELVTPILKYDDIETLQEIIRLLRKAGAKSDATRGCGVHVHIGANGQTAQSLRTIANIMASHEKLLTMALKIDRSRINTYCKMVDPNFLKAVNSYKPKTLPAFADLWYKTLNANYGRADHYNPSRYHMLNYHATFTKGTIEFRLFQFDAPANGKQNGLHAGQLKAYIQLCLAICAMAKCVRTASPKEPQYDNPKYAMRGWLLQLGFIGDEFDTARKVFMERLSGDAACRPGRVA